MKIINDSKLFGKTQGLLAAAMIAAMPAVAGATAQFEVLDNPGDPNFNQLLGINDNGIIVGYFGDGTAVANNGYMLVPANHYSVENFTHVPAGDHASQTQAIGITNGRQPGIVGFYTDANTGFTHGFLDLYGTQVTLDDPEGDASKVASPLQNLLGVNDDAQAAGFWTDSNGHEHGFVVSFNDLTGAPKSFTEVSPSLFKGAVATQVSNINNEHSVCGFWTDKNAVSHGFYGVLGKTYTSFEVEINGVQAASTQAFGCNNNGDIVGQFTDASGELHGFIDHGGKFTQFDAPGSSQVAAFGVQGTLINGINDMGDIVGFFSNGRSKVKGFVEYDAD